MIKQMMPVLALLLIVGAGEASETDGAEIVINKRVDVSGETVLLGDIAKIRGDESVVQALEGLLLGKSPSPGSYRTLKGKKIMAYLNEKGWGEVNVNAPEEIRIWRKAATLPKEEIVLDVRNRIIERMPWPKDMAEVTVYPLKREILLPHGAITFSVDIPKKFNFIGTELVNVDVYVNGEKENDLWVKTEIKVYTTMVVASRPVLRNETLNEGDLRLEKRLVSSIPREVFNNPSDIVGMRAKRALKKGELITEGDIVMPPLFSRGNMVTILAEKGPLVISTLGRALEKGYKGKIVRVENVSSKKVVFTEVVDSKTVKIRF